MSAISKKSFDHPDETRSIQKGTVQVVKMGDTTAMRGIFEPGWRWSTCVKPVVGGSSCQVAHTLYTVSGRMGVRMDDGSEIEYGPGDVGVVPPGHDAWVIGNEPCVSVDFQGGASYAKPKA